MFDTISVSSPSIRATPPSMPAKLLFFPPAFPDETLISRVSRYHLMSRNRTDQSTFIELFGRAGFGLGAVVPPHIGELALRLPGELNTNVTAIHRESTLLPAFRPFLGRSSKSPSPPSDEDDEGAGVSHLPRHVVGMSGEAKLCLSCANDDEKLHGAGYWHRSHQIPGVTVCSKHQEALISSCPNCRYPFQHTNRLLSVPWGSCYQCKQRLNKAGQGQTVSELEVAYARYAHDLLQENMASVPPDILMNTYREKIRQRGYVRKSQIDLKSFQEAMIQDLGEPFIRKVDPAFSLNRTSTWLRLSYLQSALDLPITRHLLMGMHLFGTASHFHIEVQAMQNAGHIALRKKATQSHASQNMLRDEFRQKITKELKKNPALSMEKLWKKQVRTMAWLFEHDKTWLNNTVTSGACREADASASKIQADDALDREGARQIEEVSRKLFEQTGKPQRVTISKILAGLSKPVASTTGNRERYPLLFAAIDLCKETAWCFSARRILWALGELDRFEETITIGNIVLRSAVGTRAVEEILQFCGWDGEKLSKTTINPRLLLAKAGITRTWRGPSENKLGEFAGRGYVSKGTRRKKLAI